MTFDNLGEEDVRKTKINLYKLDMKIVSVKLRKNILNPGFATHYQPGNM